MYPSEAFKIELVTEESSYSGLLHLSWYIVSEYTLPSSLFLIY